MVVNCSLSTVLVYIWAMIIEVGIEQLLREGKAFEESTRSPKESFSLFIDILLQDKLMQM